MESNNFELIGRVNNVDIQYKESGTIVTRTLLGKKNSNSDTFDTYPIILFGKLAEQYAEVVKKGDTVYLHGKINVNRYVKDGKTVEKYELVAFEFKKVKYNTDAKQYIVLDDNAQSDSTKTVSKTSTKVAASNTTAGDDRPWG